MDTISSESRNTSTPPTGMYEGAGLVKREMLGLLTGWC
jgi:hypothetical protein